MRIGADTGADSTALLQGVRGVIVQSSGQLVVLDAASASLRFFDTIGRSIRRVGRRGGGPGEFPTGVYGLYRCAGDSLIVREQRRLSIFDQNGRFVRHREVTVSAAGRAVEVVGISTDCRATLVSESAGPPVQIGSRVIGTTHIRHVDATGRWSDVRFELQGPVGAAVQYLGRSVLTRVPWSSTGLLHTNGELLVEGNTKEPEVRLRSFTGDLRQVIRWESVAEPISPADRALFTEQRDAYLTLYPESRSRLPDLAALPIPNEKPFFSRVLIAADSSVWVRAHSISDAGLPGILDASADSSLVLWNVFSPDGVLRRRVRLPAGLRIAWAHGDHAIGVLFSKDDEETIVGLRLFLLSSMDSN